MTTLAVLFAAPLTWMIFGAAGQLALAAYVRDPRSYLWGLAPCIMVVCLLAAIPSALGGTAEAYQIGMAFGLMMSAGIVASAAPAAMSEGSVLAITTTYWITFIVTGGRAWWGGFSLPTAVVLGALPTAALAYYASTGARPGRQARLVLYLWGVAALLLTGAVNFPHNDFGSLERSGRSWVVILSATYLGAHLAMLVHNAAALIMMLPIPAKHQPLKERLKQVEAYSNALIERFSPEAVGPRTAACAVLGQGAFVWLMSLWRPEGAGIALHASLSLILISTIFFYGGTRGHGGLPTGGDLKREARRRRSKG